MQAGQKNQTKKGARGVKFGVWCEREKYPGGGGVWVFGPKYRPSVIT